MNATGGSGVVGGRGGGGGSGFADPGSRVNIFEYLNYSTK